MAPEVLAILMVGSLLALILAGIPVAFAIGAAGMAFGLVGFGTDLFQLLPARIFGVATSYTLLAIPLFVFMGVLLEKSRLAENMLDVMGHLAGRTAGGMAVGIVLVGVLMGASTGIVGATVVTVGLITLPVLLRRRYHVPTACGTICASGTLGQIIPPSLVLILLADITGESIGTLYAAALVPGLMLAGLYVGYLLLLGRVRPDLVPPIDEAERHALPRRELFRQLVRTLLPPLLLILAVLGSIIGGIAAPTEAASMGALGALLVTGAAGQLNRVVLRDTMQTTLKITGMIMFILMTAQIFSLAFRGLDGERVIEAVFQLVPGGTTGAVVFLMAVLFVLGCFLEWIEISYIALPLMLPFLQAAQVDMVWLATLVALNLQASFLTPPFGWSLFFLKGVAPPAVTTRDIYSGVTPFVGLQVAAVALVMVFPALATWLPKAVGW